MKKMVVTGSEGFIGKKLVERLTLEDREIFCIDDEYLQNENWEEALETLLSTIDFDIVYHVGACSDTLEQNVNFMMVRNYEATKVLSRIASAKNAKFIYSSSAANYGINDRYPANLYGWSKYAAEDYVRLSGGVSLRYFNVYGPGEENKGNMASFLHQAYLMHGSGTDVKLFPGKPSRDFIHVNDVVEANIHAAQAYFNLKGQVFEVSTGTSRTFEEMLDLADIPYTYTSEEKIPSGYQFYTCGDRGKHMPGWVPKVNLELGVKTYIEHLHKLEH